MCITYCTCDKGIHVLKYQIFICVHVYAIKYDHMKECDDLLMNSLNWSQSNDFFFSNDTKKLCASHVLVIKMIILNIYIM